MPGNSTSDVEISGVSPEGFTLIVGGEALQVPFAEFPWFRHATVAQLADVTHPTADHLYWPQLDLDLSVASIRNPADFPLVAGPRGVGRVAEPR